MAEFQDILLFRGTAPRLRFKLVRPENVQGWTTRLVVKKTAQSANTLFSKDGTLANLTDVPNAITHGVFDVILTANNTTILPAGDYQYSFRRVDEGFEDVLSTGKYTLVDAP